MPPVIHRDVETWTFRVYVTDALHGLGIVRRWADWDKPVETDSRTGDDIDRELSEKFGWTEVSENGSV